MKGTIKNIVVDRLFGFISSDREYFFHKADFNGHWEDLIADYEGGMSIEVEFDTVESKKGWRASNVRRLDWPNSYGG